MATMVKAKRLDDVQRKQLEDFLKRHGFQSDGDSVEEFDDGTKRLHISLVTGGVGTLSNTLGQGIKNILGMDEVYNLGVKLA